MSGTIILRRDTDHNCWVSDWIGTDRASEILDLFGTCLIPMPYTAAADDQTVATAIRRLNPEYLVHVE